MPRRRTHVFAGAASGAAFAAYRSWDAPPPQLVAETLGGLVGGCFGGILPDLLEPATSPNHRHLAHSVVAGGALTLARIGEWQASCRLAADAAMDRSRRHAVDCPERRQAETEAIFWRFFAGALVGLVAGYASHLILDATTKRSLPFFIP